MYLQTLRDASVLRFVSLRGLDSSNRGGLWILRSEVNVWLHFSDRFICKEVDIGIIYDLLPTGEWI